MKIIMLALTSVLLLAACGAPPKLSGSSRSSASSTPSDITESASAQTRELALYALSQIGVRYRYGGTSPESGFDCRGLVYYLYQRGTGRVLPRNTQGLSEVGPAVNENELELGDLVFFNTLG